MSVKIIQEAFMTDFAAMVLNGFGKIYPNLPYSGQKPYVSMQFVHTDPINVGLGVSAGSIFNGYLLFTIVTELGEGLAQAADAAQLIADRYPFGKIIDVTGGRIEIPLPTYVVDGFRQDKDWRTPIRVPYRGHF